MNFNPYLHSSGGNFRSWRRAALEGRFLWKYLYMVYFRSFFFFSVFVCLVGTRIHDIFLHTIHIRDKKNKQIKKVLAAYRNRNSTVCKPYHAFIVFVETELQENETVKEWLQNLSVEYPPTLSCENMGFCF